MCREKRRTKGGEQPHWVHTALDLRRGYGVTDEGLRAVSRAHTALDLTALRLCVSPSRVRAAYLPSPRLFACRNPAT